VPTRMQAYWIPNTADSQNQTNEFWLQVFGYEPTDGPAPMLTGEGDPDAVRP
jgi:hypothetical protein